MKNNNNNIKADLSNKLAYVLGGFGLIGKEVVKKLLINGAEVLILDMKTDTKALKEFKNIKNEVNFCKFDITKTKDIEKNYKNILKKHNTPNIFVNCSYPRTKDWKFNTFNKVQFSSFKDNIEYQLISTSWISYLTALSMKRNKIQGSVILIGSIYGLKAQDLNLYKGTKISPNFTYPLIKGGLTNFNKQLAVFFAKDNIRINTVAPGGVIDKQDKIFINNYINKNPSNRMAEPNEIASIILFLSSDDSSHITAETITIDGGISKI